MRPDRVASPARRLRAFVRGIDHAIGRWTGKRRVLIDVRTPMNLAVLRPVWLALSRDARISLAFAAEQHESVRAALARDAQDHALRPRSAAVWARWDLVLTADAWNHTPVRRCLKRMQFFHGVAGKYDLDEPGRIRDAGLDLFDRIAFINDDRMQRYLRAGVVAPTQAVLVGYPKADALINGECSGGTIRRTLGLDPSRPTVLYAPTFSTAGSLHHAGLAIVAALLESGVNVIVKLHDRSMTPDAHHTGGLDWPAQFSTFAGNPRFAMARGADAEPFLAAADVLVTDHSTVGFEFALLDRPIVVYDAPALLHAARIDAGKWALLRSMSSVVQSPAEMMAEVQSALRDPSRLREQRARARDLFAAPGTATQRALAVVYELLNVEPTMSTQRQTDAPPLPAAAGARR